MRGLILWLRQCFCQHEWVTEERDMGRWSPRLDSWALDFLGYQPRVSATCTKCGYHRSYWKF